MELFKELVGSDIGLLSFGTIIFIVIMAIWYCRFFMKHIKEEEEQQAAAKQ